MPKMKTKSGAKKRFKMTATGKVKCQAQRKRHGMIQAHDQVHPERARHHGALDEDAKIVKKNSCPTPVERPQAA